MDYDKTKQELEDLQGFLEIKQQHTEDQYSEPCDIIGYVTNDPFGSFYIDQGSKDGISSMIQLSQQKALLELFPKFQTPMPL